MIYLVGFQLQDTRPSESLISRSPAHFSLSTKPFDRLLRRPETILVRVLLKQLSQWHLPRLPPRPQIPRRREPSR